MDSKKEVKPVMFRYGLKDKKVANLESGVDILEDKKMSTRFGWARKVKWVGEV